MAAQSLVRESYNTPADTYATNVMGTVNFLEAVRLGGQPKVAVVVTSDKCYENAEAGEEFEEGDRLGGHDPYSNSKACAELVTAAYTKSFFAAPDSTKVASVRAGNVIGGGDWAADRLIPDLVRGAMAGDTVPIRSPEAIRPWQHVLEPVAGYLLLCEKLWNSDIFGVSAWNFGPSADSTRTVLEVAEHFASKWSRPDLLNVHREDKSKPEAQYLRLNSNKASTQLGWRPGWGLHRAIEETVDWYKHFEARGDMAEFTRGQIDAYQRAGELVSN